MNPEEKFVVPPDVPFPDVRTTKPGRSLRLASQAVEQPGPQRRAPRNRRPREQEELPRMVVEGVPVHGADQGQMSSATEPRWGASSESSMWHSPRGSNP